MHIVVQANVHPRHHPRGSELTTESNKKPDVSQTKSLFGRSSALLAILILGASNGYPGVTSISTANGSVMNKSSAGRICMQNTANKLTEP